MCSVLRIKVILFKRNSLKMTAEDTQECGDISYEIRTLIFTLTIIPVIPKVNKNCTHVNFRITLINSMEQSLSSWAANTAIMQSANQEILRFLWNLKDYYLVRKGPPSVPILSQMNPIHNPKPCFPKVHFNVILLSTPRSSEFSFPFRLSNQNFARISHLHMLATCPTHLILLDLIILMICREEYKLWSFSLCNFLQPRVTSLKSKCSPHNPVLKHPQSAFFLQRDRHTHTKQREKL
jgi:hypothetical protein